MKGKMIPICCPACEVDNCEPAYEMEEFEFEVSTADLIAELEKRRPCKECQEDKWHKCSACVFGGEQIYNNFKPSK